MKITQNSSKKLKVLAKFEKITTKIDQNKGVNRRKYTKMVEIGVKNYIYIEILQK